MGKLSEEAWEEIQKKVKSGKKVSDLAKEYDVSSQNIYHRLGSKASPKSELLQINKLKRECDELKKLLGIVTYELNKEKKVI